MEGTATEIATQTESGFGVAHFACVTPYTGAHEFMPTPVGMDSIRAGSWTSGKGGRSVVKGVGTQTGKGKKNKGVETRKGIEIIKEMEKWNEERIRVERMEKGSELERIRMEKEDAEKKWKEERIRKDKERRIVQYREWKLKEVKVEKRNTNKERYEEWVIRSRVRTRKMEDDEQREAEEVLRKWCENRIKEREFSLAVAETIAYEIAEEMIKKEEEKGWDKAQKEMERKKEEEERRATARRETKEKSERILKEKEKLKSKKSIKKKKTGKDLRRAVLIKSVKRRKEEEKRRKVTVVDDQDFKSAYGEWRKWFPTYEEDKENQQDNKQ